VKILPIAFIRFPVRYLFYTTCRTRTLQLHLYWSRAPPEYRTKSHRVVIVGAKLKCHFGSALAHHEPVCSPLRFANVPTSPSEYSKRENHFFECIGPGSRRHTRRHIFELERSPYHTTEPKAEAHVSRRNGLRFHISITPPNYKLYTDTTSDGLLLLLLPYPVGCSGCLEHKSAQCTLQSDTSVCTVEPSKPLKPLKPLNRR
jgi:hypothetical protein